MKNFASFLLVSLGISLGIAQPTSTVNQRYLLEKGIELFDAGNYAEAKQQFEQILALDKRNVPALFELAHTYEAMGNYKKAISICKKAIKRQEVKTSILSNFYVIYGNSLDKNGSVKKACKVYEKGIAQFPDYYLLHFNLGIAYLGNKQYQEAKQQFYKTVQVKPDHLGGHYYLSMVARKLNQRIPAVLAGARYLSLDIDGQRADNVRAVLPNLLVKNLEELEDGVSILLSGVDLTEENPADNFMAIELMLDLNTVKLKEERGRSIRKDIHGPYFKGNFTLFCQLLDNYKQQHGFFWEYYAPFFYSLNANNHLDTFLHFISPDRTQSKEWMKQHEDKVAAFLQWSEEYEWD